MAGDLFGSAISADANYTAIAAKGYGLGAGKVYIFQKGTNEDSGEEEWTQMADFQGSDTSPGDAFGSALACFGNITVVGAPNHDTLAGAAYIFKLMDNSENNNDMVWTEIAKLENPDTSESSGLFGFSLGFDGKALVVGAPKANGAGNGNEQGEVYVYN